MATKDLDSIAKAVRTLLSKQAANNSAGGGGKKASSTGRNQSTPTPPKPQPTAAQTQPQQQPAAQQQQPQQQAQQQAHQSAPAQRLSNRLNELTQQSAPVQQPQQAAPVPQQQPQQAQQQPAASTAAAQQPATGTAQPQAQPDVQQPVQANAAQAAVQPPVQANAAHAPEAQAPQEVFNPQTGEKETLPEGAKINPYTGKPLQPPTPVTATIVNPETGEQEEVTGQVNPYTGKPLQNVTAQPQQQANAAQTAGQADAEPQQQQAKDKQQASQWGGSITEDDIRATRQGSPEEKQEAVRTLSKKKFDYAINEVREKQAAGEEIEDADIQLVHDLKLEESLNNPTYGEEANQTPEGEKAEALRVELSKKKEAGEEISNEDIMGLVESQAEAGAARTAKQNSQQEASKTTPSKEQPKQSYSGSAAGKQAAANQNATLKNLTQANVFTSSTKNAIGNFITGADDKDAARTELQQRIDEFGDNPEKWNEWTAGQAKQQPQPNAAAPQPQVQLDIQQPQQTVQNTQQVANKLRQLPSAGQQPNASQAPAAQPTPTPAPEEEAAQPSSASQYLEEQQAAAKATGANVSQAPAAQPTPTPEVDDETAGIASELRASGKTATIVNPQTGEQEEVTGHVNPYTGEPLENVTAQQQAPQTPAASEEETAQPSSKKEEPQWAKDMKEEMAQGMSSNTEGASAENMKATMTGSKEDRKAARNKIKEASAASIKNKTSQQSQPSSAASTENKPEWGAKFNSHTNQIREKQAAGGKLTQDDIQTAFDIKLDDGLAETDFEGLGDDLTPEGKKSEELRAKLSKKKEAGEEISRDEIKELQRSQIDGMAAQKKVRDSKKAQSQQGVEQSPQPKRTKPNHTEAMKNMSSSEKADYMREQIKQRTQRYQQRNTGGQMVNKSKSSQFKKGKNLIEALDVLIQKQSPNSNANASAQRVATNTAASQKRTAADNAARKKAATNAQAQQQTYANQNQQQQAYTNAAQQPQQRPQQLPEQGEQGRLFPESDPKYNYPPAGTAKPEDVEARKVTSEGQARMRGFETPSNISPETYEYREDVKERQAEQNPEVARRLQAQKEERQKETEDLIARGGRNKQDPGWRTREREAAEKEAQEERLDKVDTGEEGLALRNTGASFKRRFAQLRAERAERDAAKLPPLTSAERKAEAREKRMTDAARKKEERQTEQDRRVAHATQDAKIDYALQINAIDDETKTTLDDIFGRGMKAATRNKVAAGVNQTRSKGQGVRNKVQTARGEEITGEAGLSASHPKYRQEGSRDLVGRFIERFGVAGLNTEDGQQWLESLKDGVQYPPEGSERHGLRIPGKASFGHSKKIWERVLNPRELEEMGIETPALAAGEVAEEEEAVSPLSTSEQVEAFEEAGLEAKLTPSQKRAKAREEVRVNANVELAPKKNKAEEKRKTVQAQRNVDQGVEKNLSSLYTTGAIDKESNNLLRLLQGKTSPTKGTLKGTVYGRRTRRSKDILGKILEVDNGSLLTGDSGKSFLQSLEGAMMREGRDDKKEGRVKSVAGVSIGGQLDSPLQIKRTNPAYDTWVNLNEQVDLAGLVNISGEMGKNLPHMNTKPKAAAPPTENTATANRRNKATGNRRNTVTVNRRNTSTEGTPQNTRMARYVPSEEESDAVINANYRELPEGETSIAIEAPEEREALPAPKETLALPEGTKPKQRYSGSASGRQAAANQNATLKNMTRSGSFTTGTKNAIRNFITGADDKDAARTELQQRIEEFGDNPEKWDEWSAEQTTPSEEPQQQKYSGSASGRQAAADQNAVLRNLSRFGSFTAATKNAISSFINDADDKDVARAELQQHIDDFQDNPEKWNKWAAEQVEGNHIKGTPVQQRTLRTEQNEIISNKLDTKTQSTIKDVIADAKEQGNEDKARNLIQTLLDEFGENSEKWAEWMKAYEAEGNQIGAYEAARNTASVSNRVFAASADNKITRFAKSIIGTFDDLFEALSPTPEVEEEIPASFFYKSVKDTDLVVNDKANHIVKGLDDFLEYTDEDKPPLRLNLFEKQDTDEDEGYTPRRQTERTQLGGHAGGKGWSGDHLVPMYRTVHRRIPRELILRAIRWVNPANFFKSTTGQPITELSDDDWRAMDRDELIKNITTLNEYREESLVIANRYDQMISLIEQGKTPYAVLWDDPDKWMTLDDRMDRAQDLKTGTAKWEDQLDKTALRLRKILGEEQFNTEDGEKTHFGMIDDLFDEDKGRIPFFKDISKRDKPWLRRTRGTGRFGESEEARRVISANAVAGIRSARYQIPSMRETLRPTIQEIRSDEFRETMLQAPIYQGIRMPTEEELRSRDRLDITAEMIRQVAPDYSRPEESPFLRANQAGSGWQEEAGVDATTVRSTRFVAETLRLTRTPEEVAADNAYRERVERLEHRTATGAPVADALNPDNVPDEGEALVSIEELARWFGVHGSLSNHKVEAEEGEVAPLFVRSPQPREEEESNESVVQTVLKAVSIDREIGLNSAPAVSQFSSGGQQGYLMESTLDVHDGRGLTKEEFAGFLGKRSWRNSFYKMMLLDAMCGSKQGRSPREVSRALNAMGFRETGTRDNQWHGANLEHMFKNRTPDGEIALFPYNMVEGDEFGQEIKNFPLQKKSGFKAPKFGLQGSIEENEEIDYTTEIQEFIEAALPRLDESKETFKRKTSDDENDDLWAALASRVASTVTPDARGRESTIKYEKLKKTVTSWMLDYFDNPEGTPILSSGTPDFE